MNLNLKHSPQMSSELRGDSGGFAVVGEVGDLVDDSTWYTVEQMGTWLMQRGAWWSRYARSEMRQPIWRHVSATIFRCVNSCKHAFGPPSTPPSKSPVRFLNTHTHSVEGGGREEVSERGMFGGEEGWRK